MESGRWQIQVIQFIADEDKMKKDLIKLTKVSKNSLHRQQDDSLSLGQVELNYDYKDGDLWIIHLNPWKWNPF